MDTEKFRVKTEVEKLREKDTIKVSYKKPWGVMSWIKAGVKKLRGKDSKNTLKTYGYDLLEMAEKLDPVIGRDDEITSVIRILISLRIMNNPILIGEPGVGKTAIVEGLAKRIVSGDVPSNIANVKLIALDFASLLSGAKHLSEFETRLNDVRKGIEKGKVILFIDNFDLIFTQGFMNGGVLLEWILARDQVQCIGATTVEKYRKHLENDVTFRKRFEKVFVAEPTVPDTISILRGIKQKCEDWYGVQIQDGALVIAAQLSGLYIINRRLPEKAVDLVCQACAEESQLKTVGPDQIAKVVSKWTGLPVSFLLRGDDKQYLIGLGDRLKQRVVGQDRAVEEIAEALLILGLRAKLGRQPMSFLLLGEPGVGKTELAKALAEELFGGGDRLVKINLSYKIENQYFKARLIGDVSGYPTRTYEAVRRRPCVILIDKVEEADSAMFSILLRVLEEGRLTDSQRRNVDFRDTLVIITSSIGAHHLSSGMGSIEAAREKVVNEVRTLFKCRLLNGLNKIVVFDPLSRDQLKSVARLQFKDVAKRLAEKGIALAVTDAALDLVSDKCYVDGARKMERWIETNVVTELAKMSLRDEIDENSTVYIDVGIDGLTYQVDKIGGIVDLSTAQRVDILIQIPNRHKADSAIQTVKTT
ncbi:chaperone protein ClpB1-like [Silene latifolia]|uniref:chaperone protein ClpB1-like n=1 Tax=Silene latifolia TaxID=37657 RepID=UPI003D785944